MSNNNRRVLLPGERFMRKNCRRCHRPLDLTDEKESCAQCRSIATMIVESCAMNLALMPGEALQDAECDSKIVAAVALARAAFLESGIEPAILTELRERIQQDVRTDITDLQESKRRKDGNLQ